ncbi:sensor histidine kinase [Marinobacter sp. C2H3]|uniref:sensor histidine kinase n=1 Tax=Marinobacter sp. C2H3 TaxID=3119003 RepID=UPI00300EE395
MTRLMTGPIRLFHSLRLTLLLSMVVPLLLISGGAIYLGLGAVESHLNDRLRGDLELVARAVSGPVSQALSDGNDLVLGESLRSLLKIGRISGVSVFDEQGQRIQSFGLADQDVQDSASAARVMASGRQDGVFRRVAGESVYSQFLPLMTDRGRIQGLLQVTRKRSDFHELLASTRFWALVLWCGLAAAIALIVVLGHYGSVGRHVSRLLLAMDRMAPGRWRVATPASGPRELRQIHQGVSALAERMATAEVEIDARIERERSLAEQLRHQEKVAMIGRVAGGVAHELGAPLNVIQGRAAILEREDTDERRLRQVQDIQVQVGRMTAIIRQLLDCFRHVPDSRRPVPVAAMVSEAVAQAREDERCQRVRLSVSGTDRPERILAEPIRVELACLNVIRNACQAAKAVVQVQVLNHDREVEVRVDDDGPGIPQDQRQDVFEPFNTSRPAGEGTGLGLAVVSSVLKEHEGRAEIRDSDLGGCRVSLFFPVETKQ